MWTAIVGSYVIVGIVWLAAACVLKRRPKVRAVDFTLGCLWLWPLTLPCSLWARWSGCESFWDVLD